MEVVRVKNPGLLLPLLRCLFLLLRATGAIAT